VNRPQFVVIAGANGAGKSTLTGGKPGEFASIPVIDPDAIARHIQVTQPGLSDLAAGKEALSAIAQSMKERSSLIIETTLSGKGYLRMMEKARASGYFVKLIYIGTNSVKINLKRIEDRVARGLHNVPEVDVRRRYVRSLDNLSVAIELSDEVFLFDNSEEIGYELIASFAEKRIWWNPVPAWATSLKLQFPDSGAHCSPKAKGGS